MKFKKLLSDFQLDFYILLCIILVGAIFRFYNLNWGSGYYFHPDENSLAGPIQQLSFPTQMHPHIFTYGSVTVYLIYFTREFFTHLPLIGDQLSSFLHPLLVGRFYSALFSALTVWIVFLICKSFLNQKWALLSALLTATTAGLIQQAHFATPETNLTFFLFCSLLFLIKFVQKANFLDIKSFIFASVFLGLALGTKVSSLVFIPTVILALAFKFLPQFRKFIFFTFLSLSVVFMTFLLTSPYALLDFQTFRNTIIYESKIASGEIQVFYTRQFIGTTPILFQLVKILPFALGPMIMSFGLGGLLLMTVDIIKKLFTKKLAKELLLIFTAFLFLSLSNAFLFIKWTRYIAPIFPFFAIFTTYLFFKLYQTKILQNLCLFCVSLTVTLSFIWSLAFLTIYTNHDVRVTASHWLESQTPLGSVFAVEGANTVDLPLNGDFNRISLDMYDLEQNESARQKVTETLEQADYFLVQSRRVFANHLRLPDQFPRTAKFYNALFTGELGFEQIKEFHSYPGLSFLGQKIEFPDEAVEETWSVFDHPVIRVFKKSISLTKEDYARFLEK